MLKFQISIFQAPLLISYDVRNITAETYEILSKEEVIAINQGNGGGVFSQICFFFRQFFDGYLRLQTPKFDYHSLHLLLLSVYLQYLDQFSSKVPYV